MPDPYPRELAARYPCVRSLGAGGMGLVFEALDVVLKRRVAVKVIRPEHATGEALARFERRELHALSRIVHENVLRLLDSGVAGGTPYLVTELLEGRPADELPVPLERSHARQILDGLLAGLAAVHDAGFLHRDVKPGNVFVCGDGRVVLLDLGLAALTAPREALTQTGSLIGTPKFLAPELLTEAAPSVRSDLYGAGVFGLWLLRGRDVFDLCAPPAAGAGDARFKGFLSALASGTYYFSVLDELKDERGGLAEALRVALAADPRDRPEDAHAMRRLLEEDRPGSRARTPAPAERTAALTSAPAAGAPGRPRFLAALAVLAGALAAIVVFASHGRRPATAVPSPRAVPVVAQTDDRAALALDLTAAVELSARLSLGWRDGEDLTARLRRDLARAQSRPELTRDGATQVHGLATAARRMARSADAAAWSRWLIVAVAVLENAHRIESWRYPRSGLTVALMDLGRVLDELGGSPAADVSRDAAAVMLALATDGAAAALYRQAVMLELAAARLDRIAASAVADSDERAASLVLVCRAAWSWRQARRAAGWEKVVPDATVPAIEEARLRRLALERGSKFARALVGRGVADGFRVRAGHQVMRQVGHAVSEEPGALRDLGVDLAIALCATLGSGILDQGSAEFEHQREELVRAARRRGLELGCGRE